MDRNIFVTDINADIVTETLVEMALKRRLCQPDPFSP